MKNRQSIYFGLSTAAVAMCIAAAQQSMAQSLPPPPPPPALPSSRPAPPAMPFLFIPDWLFSPVSNSWLKAITFTDDQRQHIGEIIDNTNRRQLFKQISDDRIQLHSLAMTVSPDVGKATAIANDEAAQIGDLIANAQSIRAKIVKDVMTEDQRKTVEADDVQLNVNPQSALAQPAPAPPPPPPPPPISSITPKMRNARLISQLSLTDDEEAKVESIQESERVQDYIDISSLLKFRLTTQEPRGGVSSDHIALIAAFDKVNPSLADLILLTFKQQSAIYSLLDADQRLIYSTKFAPGPIEEPKYASQLTADK